MGRNGIHQSFSDVLVLNPITPLTSGGSRDLADGQVGLFEDTTTSRGLKAIGDVTHIKGKKKIALEVGTAFTGTAGGYSRKGMRTVWFKPEDVLDVTYSEAKPATQGEVILGYDGFDTTKSINLAPGESSQVHVKLVGDPLAFYGFSKGTWEKSFAFSQPDVGDCEDECVEGACHDVVKNLTKTMKKTMVREGIHLEDLIDIRFISDCSDQPTPTETGVFYRLTVKDNGTSKDLALVQGQYPGYTVQRYSYDNGYSTYQIVKTDGGGLPGVFTEWQPNLLTDCGDTCPAGYTAVPGGFLYSIAWDDGGVDGGNAFIEAISGLSVIPGKIAVGGLSTSTGADVLRPAGTYNITTPNGDADAPGTGTGAEFDIVVDGVGAITSITVVTVGQDYAVGDVITIADALLGGGGAPDVVVDVDALSADTVVTITKVGQQYGTGKYAILSVAELTQAELDALKDADDTVALDENYTEVADVCVADTPITTAWTTYTTCDVAETPFYIWLPDTVCDESRLPELQASYPDLTITESADPAPANCMRRYETTVLSQIVCDECRPDQFEWVKPRDFEFAQWKEGVIDPATSGTDSVDCKCGISIKGKDLELCPPSHHADMIGTINGQIRVEISGGELLGHKIGYKYNTDVPWTKTRVSRAFDGTGWGCEFISAEKASYDRFLSVNSGDSWAEQWFKGNETKLDTCTQYDTITLKVRRTIPSQSMSKELNEIIRYVFVLPPGSRSTFDSFFTAVAGANPEAVSI